MPAIAQNTEEESLFIQAYKPYNTKCYYMTHGTPPLTYHIELVVHHRDAMMVNVVQHRRWKQSPRVVLRRKAIHRLSRDLRVATLSGSFRLRGVLHSGLWGVVEGWLDTGSRR